MYVSYNKASRGWQALAWCLRALSIQFVAGWQKACLVLSLLRSLAVVVSEQLDAWA